MAESLLVKHQLLVLNRAETVAASASLRSGDSRQQMEQQDGQITHASASAYQARGTAAKHPGIQRFATHRLLFVDVEGVCSQIRHPGRRVPVLFVLVCEVG
jgi:hypothetical protein